MLIIDKIPVIWTGTLASWASWGIRFSKNLFQAAAWMIFILHLKHGLELIIRRWPERNFILSESFFQQRLRMDVALLRAVLVIKIKSIGDYEV